MQPIHPIYLKCSACGHVEYCDHHRVFARLRELKMLRRDAEPDAATVEELLRHAASRFVCVACEAIGLELFDEDPHAAAAWGDAVKCEVCQTVIPRERLEVLPGTRRCANCQSREEQGQEVDTADYCPRCGDILQLRPRPGSGLAGYRAYCPTCGRSSS